VKIMIVDDNSEMRALIRSLLRDLAEEIEDYGDGESALANYDKNRPDWSVVDLEMPLMDGLAVTSWIKSHDPEARVIVMSQSPNPQVRAVALESGATAFVPKENLLQLRNVIMSVGQRIPAQREPHRVSSKDDREQNHTNNNKMQ